MGLRLLLSVFFHIQINNQHTKDNFEFMFVSLLLRCQYLDILDFEYLFLITFQCDVHHGLSHFFKRQ